MTVISTLKSWRQEGQNFKVICGYTANLRSDWDLRPCLKNINTGASIHV